MRALVGSAIFSSRAKWRSSSECMSSCARKELDTADIVREAISQHVASNCHQMPSSRDLPRTAKWNIIPQNVQNFAAPPRCRGLYLSCNDEYVNNSFGALLAGE